MGWDPSSRGFLAANGDVMKTEDVKTDILANRTVKVVTEAGR